jgi:hypothetical protein
MGQGSLLALAQAFATDPASSDSQIRAAELQAAFAKAAAPPPAAAGGKENSSGAKDVRDAALHCFKAVQQRLAQPGGGDAAQLVAVGRASLAAAAALTPPTPASTAQLQGWRYNFARRLVSCKAFVDAQEEAWALFQQLNCAQPAAPTSGGGAAAVKAASLMVGTVLTLVLCCVEGKLLGNAEAVSGMLQAAESLPPWLRCAGLPTRSAAAAAARLPHTTQPALACLRAIQTNSACCCCLPARLLALFLSSAAC